MWQLMDILCIECLVLSRKINFGIFNCLRNRERENKAAAELNEVIVLTVDQYAHSYHYANRRFHTFSASSLKILYTPLL